MGTVKAENGTGFDVEIFGKTVALFDSNNAGEAENAFRKAVLMCAKNGLRFCDAAGMAFGQYADAEVAELQDQLRQQEAERASQLTEAAEEIQRLRGQLAGDAGGGEHVIDLGGRLRRAWVFPQFRLFVLTVMIGTAASFADARLWSGTLPGTRDDLARVYGWSCVLPFGAWSVAQFRKRGLGQVFLKWLVYASALMVGGVLLDSVDADKRPIALVGFLAAALVLTLSKLSEWLGEKIRVHVWESSPVHVVRGWF
jgi:hypothetical protein